MDSWEAVLRLLAAGALGGVIGFEREFSDQPAGFRTHILVSLGAALFTMVGAYGLEDFTADPTFRSDPTRIAAQVVTGIGFLGAGAILQRGIRVRGLTTAAAMWVTAAIGMAAGFGYWAGALGTTVISLVALYLLKMIEGRLFAGGRAAELSIETDGTLDLAGLEQVFAAHGVHMQTLKLASTDRGHHASVRLKATSAQVKDLLSDVSDLPTVTRVDWRA